MNAQESIESQVIKFLTSKAYHFMLDNEIIAGTPTVAFFASTQQLRDICQVGNTGGEKNAFRDLLNRMANEGKLSFFIMSKPATHLWFINLNNDKEPCKK